MSHKSHKHMYITRGTMHESKHDMHEVSHTKESSPSHTLPLSLTYSLPLPLWRQAPKSKGLKAGQEQTSWALEYGERSETVKCHPRTLDSGL
jgi:hypothetical protein